MNTFSFGVEFQRALLRLIQTDEAFCFRAMSYVEPGFFTTRSLGWAFTVMQKYYLAYEMRMTDLPLREAALKNPEHAAEVEAIIEVGQVAEADYIRAELREFIRRNIFARSHEESQKLYNAGQHGKAYEITCAAMDSLRQVEFDIPDRSWLFEELPERMRSRFKGTRDPTEGVYPTGMDAVDDCLNGGAKRGEVHLVIAPPKAGKTIWLINQAFVITRVARKPVLYINLEGSTRLITDRFDACFSTELYTAVRRGEIRPNLYREMTEEYRQLRGLCVVRTLNDWDVNILHVTAELKSLEAQGFIPEAIMLDYVDRLRSRNQVGSETQHQIDSMNDTKRLANRGYLIWTACQSQRPKEGDEDREFLLKASQIADAYGKIRIADGYGSLNATRAEAARGECRYFLENYRDGPVGKVFRLHNETDRMRIAVSVTEEKRVAAPIAAPPGAPPTAGPAKPRSKRMPSA